MKLLGISGVAGSGKDTFAKFFGPMGSANVALADPLKRIARDVYDFTDEQLWGPSEERNKPDPRYPREHTWVRATEQDKPIWTCACCSTVVPFTGRALTQEEEKEQSPCFLTPRYALQLLGTNWGRHCYGNTWVDKCIRTAGQLLRDPSLRYDFKRGVYRIGETRDWGGENMTEEMRVKLVTVSDVRFRNEIEAFQKAGGKVVRVKRPGAGLGGAAGLHPSEAEMMSIPDSAFDFVVENDQGLDDLNLKAIELGRTFG